MQYRSISLLAGIAAATSSSIVSAQEPTSAKCNLPPPLVCPPEAPTGPKMNAVEIDRYIFDLDTALVRNQDVMQKVEANLGSAVQSAEAQRIIQAKPMIDGYLSDLKHHQEDMVAYRKEHVGPRRDD